MYALTVVCVNTKDEHVYTNQHLSHVGMSMFTFCCQFSLKIMNSVQQFKCWLGYAYVHVTPTLQLTHAPLNLFTLSL